MKKETDSTIMKKPCLPPPDIISDLPNSIIDNILVRLPISEAVGTSILSSKWRYKWVTLPNIVIDTSLGKRLLERRRQFGEFEVVQAVYQLLLLHKGSIVKFSLQADNLQGFSHVDNWIHFLSNNHHIQEFTLSRAKFGRYKLPSYFFNFEHLRHLKLRYCVFRPPPGFKGFSELVILELEEVIMDAETFSWVVSSSPLLQQLVVTSYIPYRSLKIRAPNLISFSFTGEFGSISFKDTPFLEQVTVSLCRVSKNPKHKSSNFVKFVRSLPAVEKLHLEGYFLEYLSTGDVPETLSDNFKNLKVLHIDEMDFSNLEEVMCALSLITSSPNLQQLKIVAYAGDFDTDAIAEYFEAQNSSKCCLKSLRTVTMEEISNFEPQIEFIKFILENAVELEKMEVIESEGTVGEGQKEMWRQLMRFRRASQRAQLIMI